MREPTAPLTDAEIDEQAKRLATKWARTLELLAKSEEQDRLDKDTK